MTEYTTKTGKVLTDADIEALADEAEKGYDVSHLAGAPDRRPPATPRLEPLTGSAEAAELVDQEEIAGE